MSKPVWIFKIGGEVLNQPEDCRALLQTLAKLRTGLDVILVHGGGQLTQGLLNAVGLESVKRDGVRLTPANHLPYIVGSLAGYANKLLCSYAIACGLTPVGLSLLDGGIAQVSQRDPELGAVGDASAGDPTLLRQLLANNMLPIISSIGASSDGELFNVNADDAAVAIATALKAKLCFLTDVNGVLDQQQQTISTLKEVQVDSLIAEGVIVGGMVNKVRAALAAAKHSRQAVTIASWQSLTIERLLKEQQASDTTIITTE